MKLKLFLFFCFCSLFFDFSFSQDTNNKIPAHFVYPSPELDSFIVDNMVRPYKALLYGINANIIVKFIINADMTLDSISIISYDRIYMPFLNNEPKINYDSVFIEYKDEALRIIKFSEGLWIPLQIDTLYLKSFMICKMSFKTESYERRSFEIKHANNFNGGIHALKFSQNSSSVKNDIPYYSADKYYNLGVKKMNEKKYLIAKKYFQEAIKLKNNDIDAWYNLGQLYMILNDKMNFCKCMRHAGSFGDTESQSLFDKYCK